ncbi:GGDEF domain-containing protein [Mangrovitalea sediminis]|uniref:GGDEF domain-containing protein n=1 Tax=Mangrovitalea sediminis TaxID=1982043 RepID=UPI000BE53DB1|nr:GGDEF domain-containing protein [Mangrovitalea sediminis]
MSLNTRLLCVLSALIISTCLASWLIFQRVTDTIVERWGRDVADIEVRYDSSRLLQAVDREIGLSRQLADSPIIQNWAKHPDDPRLKDQAIAEMERFRLNFADRNYFVALHTNNAYYFNNAANEYAGKQLRYHLNPQNPADAWFYQLIQNDMSFHLNVNPDENLGITKLWIDVLVKDKQTQKILGVAGTGIDLESFLKNIVDLNKAGVNTLFVDENGAIQLYRDTKYIDYASFVKPEGQKNTIDLLMARPSDQQAIHRMMKQLLQPTAKHHVETAFVNVEGKRQLAGVAYLPTIGWYEVTLLDLDVLLPFRIFLPVAGVFGVALILSLLVFHFFVRRIVIRPINRLDAAVRDFQAGGEPPLHLPAAAGELGRLNTHFGAMANAVANQAQILRDTVESRTRDLQRQARIDPLTGLLNRRGMSENLEEAFERARREEARFGLVLIDVDNFKDINDRHGHPTGDAALKAVSEQIGLHIRPYDHASRWGGDEFLVTLSPCSGDILNGLSDRICRAITENVSINNNAVTVSIGAYLVQSGDSMELALQEADRALYRSKAAGRNRVFIIHRDTLPPENGSSCV